MISLSNCIHFNGCCKNCSAYSKICIISRDIVYAQGLCSDAVFI